jgi:hypothetical protein
MDRLSRTKILQTIHQLNLGWPFGYGNTGSLTSHGHIGSSVNTLYEYGPSVQYAHPGSSNCFSQIIPSGNKSAEHGLAVTYCEPGSLTSYRNESRNLSTENSPSLRHRYTGSSISFGYLFFSTCEFTNWHVMSVDHDELQYGNLGSSTSFAHPGLSPSIARPQSSASIDRSRSSFFMERLGSPDSIVHPGSSVSVGTPESCGSIDRPGSSGSIARPGSSISQIDSCFSGEHWPWYRIAWYA